MRVALFGGTFDPIHRGHLAIAEAAANAFALDQVLFAPAGRQPLKPEGTPTAFADRLAMVALACAADSRFAVSELDAPHSDGTPNYTVDTITALRKQMSEERVFVLVGADSFLGLRRWHESERLLASAEWIVVSRPGFSLADLSGMNLSAEELGRVSVLDGVQEDVSATELRQRLMRGEVCDELLPETVCGYIRRHGLYGGAGRGTGIRF
jgi:nicotinate-nucleotide adenylyltransferase